MSKYNFVSSYAKYEKIKDDSEAEITEGSTYSCDTTIFTEGCTDESFLHNCLIATKYLNHIKDPETTVNIDHACKYLSYWAYEKVEKESKYSYNVSTFLENIMKAEYINVCKGYAENITEEVFSKIQSLIELYKSLAQIQTSEEVKEEAGDDDVGDDEVSDDDVSDEVEREEDEGEEDEGEEYTCQSNTMSVELYEKFRDICNLNSDKHLCNEVENFRFTPFGSWIRNRISGRKNLMNKIDKENREAQYASERQDTPYRVGYHSSR
ncbi:unnamed protein product [Plasmodium vivax]|uniref:(malaria parasite P. vivax) hypothetical protein n=1 Tax=Plasmodium vivax TaxID=5855 RepID=A0A8S4H8U7_PLAVI|nr:unnamed protein product [Plasmodium vivax]